jgi:hypothetical protein
MKYKRIASLLARAIASGAQSLSPAPPSASGKAVQAPCGGADAASPAGKGNHGMHRNAFGSDSKEVVSCCPVNDASQTGSRCKGRDGKACGKASEDAVGGCSGHGAAGHEMAGYSARMAPGQSSLW